MLSGFLDDFVPDRRFESTVEAVENIPDDIQGIILDVDGVLVEPGLDINRENIGDELAEKLEELSLESDICLLTNRDVNDSFQFEILDVGQEVEVIEDASKPRSEAFESGIDCLNVDRADVVMIGDSPFTDVYGANRSGLSIFQVDQDRSKYSMDLRITKSLEDLFQRFSYFILSK